MSEHLVTVICVLLAGYLLLAVELFVIPGFGKAGIAGIVLLMYASWLASRRMGAGWGLGVLALSLATITSVVLYIPRSRIGREIVHRATLERAHAVATSIVVGAEGEADSDLRPAGIARFGDLRENVVTGGEFINHKSRIRVVHIDGAKVVVEQVPEKGAPS